MRILRAGVAYLALVFGAGFVLGAIRVPLLVPRLGVRVAELVEMPLMFVVILWAARFVVRRFDLPPTPGVRLLAGTLALTLLVTAELALAAFLQRQSATEYVAGRDPVSGSVYLAMLVVFAAMPLVLVRAGGRRLSSGLDRSS
jgi:hypothetical protein